MSDLRELLPLMMQGTLVTIEIAFASILLAIAMASVATAMRSAHSRIVRWTSNAYVEVFRDTFLLVQLFWLFFCCPCRLSICN